MLYFLLPQNACGVYSAPRPSSWIKGEGGREGNEKEWKGKEPLPFRLSTLKPISASPSPAFSLRSRFCSVNSRSCSAVFCFPLCSRSPDFRSAPLPFSARLTNISVKEVWNYPILHSTCVQLYCLVKLHHHFGHVY